MQNVPITEHERRYFIRTQVLCVPMPNGIPRLLFQRTDGMSADFCRPDRSAKTTKDGRSCPHFSRLSPAGVPVGRRAASIRPGININKNPVCINGNAAKDGKFPLFHHCDGFPSLKRGGWGLGTETDKQTGTWYGKEASSRNASRFPEGT